MSVFDHTGIGERLDREYRGRRPTPRDAHGHIRWPSMQDEVERRRREGKPMSRHGHPVKLIDTDDVEPIEDDLEEADEP